MSAKVVGRAEIDISQADIERIAAEAGHAFYLLDLDRFRLAYEEFHGAFRRRLGNKFALAYSVKTNYTPRLLRLVRELGGQAEAVSELEYEMALRAGFSPTQIVVDGPFHEPRFLKQLLLQGTRVNLDGRYMLTVLDQVSRAHPERRFRVGLRLSYPLPGTGWTRFGFEVTEPDMLDLARWFRERPNCELVGLHSHFPLARHDLGMARARMEGLIGAATKWFPDSTFEYIDMGGGFRRPPEGPGFSMLAGELASLLEQAFAGRELPELLLEPGSALVAHTMALVCRVYDVKRAGGRILALVNASNLFINTMMWKTELAVRHYGRSHPETGAEGQRFFDVVGNTSTERKDIICTDVAGDVEPGDYLLFDAIGAYSNGLKPPFIHACPAMVARSGGHYEVVKRQETTDDILRTYV